MFSMLTVGAVQSLSHDDKTYYFASLAVLAPADLADVTYQNLIAAAQADDATLEKLRDIAARG